MIELVIGEKGKGKTRKMVDMANDESKVMGGSIIYIDKTNKHMYELSNSIRLINLRDYMIETKESFLGFIQGIISSDNDITHIYLDNFMLLANIDTDELKEVLDIILMIAHKNKVSFVLSTAVSKEQIPEEYVDSIFCIL